MTLGNLKSFKNNCLALLIRCAPLLRDVDGLASLVSSPCPDVLRMRTMIAIAPPVTNVMLAAPAFGILSTMRIVHIFYSSQFGLGVYYKQCQRHNGPRVLTPYVE